MYVASVPQGLGTSAKALRILDELGNTLKSVFSVVIAIFVDMTNKRWEYRRNIALRHQGAKICRQQTFHDGPPG